MPYDWPTNWPGVFERHADHCPYADTGVCSCGPLGYIAAILDPDTGARVTSPLLETSGEARAWRREQELAVQPGHVAVSDRNGNGRDPRVSWPEEELEPEVVAAPVAREPRRRAAPAPAPELSHETPRQPPRPRQPRQPRPAPDTRPMRTPAPSRRASPRAAADERAFEPPPRAAAADELTVPALIDRFLDAAEAGEARGSDGRPYSDQEIAEFEWAFAGYVENNFADLDASAIRGRHIFRLIDDLEDAGMPRTRLQSVVRAVRELFDYAADLGVVQVNPATYVSLPSEPRRRSRLPETIETRTAPSRSESSGPFGDNVVSERAIWFSVKIVTLIFILIALVLVAESV